ncbi:hypothetical protein, partial [Enterobacter intestinihominis]
MNYSANKLLFHVFNFPLVLFQAVPFRPVVGLGWGLLPGRLVKKPPAVAALLIAHSPRPGGHFRQGIFLLTKMRVIVGYLLPLPPQNA